jgi:hypothetical protein
MKILSEHSNDNGSLAAIIYLIDEHFSVDFFKNGKYDHNIDYVTKDIRYVEDAAENYVNGLFANVKEYSEI